MKSTFVSVAISILTIAAANTNATELDAMLVFSSDSGLSSTEKVALAASYQLHLAAVYDLQLDSDESVIVWPLIAPEMSYTAANKSNLQALNWMKDQNKNPVSPLSVAREALGSGGADVVIMVVPGTTDGDCGAAFGVPTLAGEFRRNSHAYAIVYSEESNPDCLEEIVIPHEAGHILYAEHEVDTNGDNIAPSPVNHATQSATSNLQTVMWSSVTENTSTLLSGFTPNVTVSGWADNVDFMSSTSFDIVAAYRPLPPPPPPPDTAMLWFSYCVGGLYSYNATWDSSQLNPGDFFEVEYMSGGVWTPWYEGAASCIPLTSTESEMFVRVRVQDIWGQVSIWVILSALGGCGGQW